MSIKGRLAKLEQHHHATAPDPHDRCLRLFQARVAFASPPDDWPDDFVPPDVRPTDGLLYPKLECFVGPDAECLHNRWADYCYERDKHFLVLRSLDEADLEESGPPLSPEDEARRRERLAAYRAQTTADLPRLEARLVRVKGERGEGPRELGGFFDSTELDRLDSILES